jgi:hypothetical protein
VAAADAAEPYSIRPTARPSITTLGKAATGDVTLEILDGAGKMIRKFSSTNAPAAEDSACRVEAAPNEDGEGGGGRGRAVPVRIDRTPGLHRVTWDLRYPGAWASAARPEGPNGPMAVPGKYSARLTVGGVATTQTLHRDRGTRA